MSASEASTLQPNTPVPIPAAQTPTAVSSPSSSGEDAESSRQNDVSQTTNSSKMEDDGRQTGATKGMDMGKRNFIGLGKKTSSDTEKIELEGNTVHPAVADSVTGIVAPVARRVLSIHSSSPPRSHPNHPYQLPSSPQRNLHSSSPRMVSPAGSQIFERDVQESAIPMPNSPSFPSHIQTEDHIPAVLDASSEAITDDKLDPDSVEIVMHSAHQPASITVTGVRSLEQSWTSSWADEMIPHPDRDDLASNYGALDATDVRRLSFISFSDIMQAEHAEHIGSKESVYVAGLRSLSSAHNRSPSPVRSPGSSQGLSTSPPTSKSASIKGFETSTRGKPLGSPISSHPSIGGGELTIETMTQALRRTGSGDLGGYRSQPLSPTSPDGTSELR